MPQIAIYTSDHGFGHAVRATFLAAALIQRGAFCHIVCDRPTWLFARLPADSFALHPRQVDPGLVQSDWLTIDVAATLARHRQRGADPATLIAREVDFLRQINADLVIAETAPIALEIAHRAGVPGGLITNFDWHWLYRELARDYPELQPLADQAHSCYQRATQVLRLPFHIGVEATFAHFTDIPLLVGQAPRNRQAVRQTLDLPANAKVLMWNFGGHSGETPDFDAILNLLPDWHLLSYANYATANPRYRQVPVAHNTTELFSALDALIGKPGYCTCAEAYAYQIPFLYFARDGYPEDLALAAHCQRDMNAARLYPQNLQDGSWLNTFHATIAQPNKPKPQTDGAAQAAAHFLKLCSNN